MNSNFDISVESPDARSDAINRARLLVAQRPVYLDTETTGFGNSDQIVEITVVDTDGSTLFTSRVKPTIPIPPDTANYHGITDTDVADCPSFAEIWPGLLRILSGRHICAYNADYDMRMIRQSLVAHGITDWLPERVLSQGKASPHHCIMKLFAAFYGDWSEYHGNYKFKKLAFAAVTLDIPSWQEHGSLADAQAARKVLEKLAEQQI